MNFLGEKLATIFAILLACAIPLAVVMFFIIRLAIRAYHERVMTGADGMIGLKGYAETDISPVGKVFVRGELWRAHSQSVIAAGENVRVVGVEGLTLEVAPAERDVSLSPRQVSVIDK
jgi:membrane-bound serine protease (ClpP class)